MGVRLPNIFIGFVLGKDNEDQLIPMIEFAHSIGCAGITVEPLRIVAPQKEWDDYIKENDPFKHLNTIGPILSQAKALAQHYSMVLNTPYIQ